MPYRVEIDGIVEAAFWREAAAIIYAGRFEKVRVFQVFPDDKIKTVWPLVRERADA